MDIKKMIFEISDAVYDMVRSSQGRIKNRVVCGYSSGGDAQFDIDDAAEKIVLDYVKNSELPVALYTEAGNLEKFCNDPKYVLIIDPIDGTRPAAAGLEMSCISIAVAPFNEDVAICDIEFALLRELKSGSVLYSDFLMNDILAIDYEYPIPNPSHVKDIDNMFWSFEFNGHPTDLMVSAYGKLIDRSANTGGVFLFNSASYSISRIITGQLDAYVDIGNRILRDHEETREQFLMVGKGALLHLFPYDICASVYLAKKAGIVCTDAYGDDLGKVPLLSIQENALSSCIATSTPELHRKLMEEINWDLKGTQNVNP